MRLVIINFIENNRTVKHISILPLLPELTSGQEIMQRNLLFYDFPCTCQKKAVTLQRKKQRMDLS